MKLNMRMKKIIKEDCKKYYITYKLSKNEGIVSNNILHGRNSFEQNVILTATHFGRFAFQMRLVSAEFHFGRVAFREIRILAVAFRHTLTCVVWGLWTGDRNKKG